MRILSQGGQQRRKRIESNDGTICNQCGNKLDDLVYRRCLKCREYYRAYKKMRAQSPDFEPRGFCQECITARERGQEKCSGCVLKSRQYHRERKKYERINKSPEVCAENGGKNPRHGSLMLCLRCNTRRRLNSPVYRAQLREEVFDHYGWECACCREKEPVFLSIDHTDGSGAKERSGKNGKRVGAGRWAFIIAQGFPSNLRTLCLNCNGSLGFHGTCPHHGWTQMRTNGRKDFGKTPQEIKDKVAAHRAKVKAEVFAAYGGKCFCCSEADWHFLTIDHIDGGGSKHRQSGLKNKSFYTWLRLNEFPPGFRVACLNCQHGVKGGKTCPHRLQK